jgi:hypothetical protein
MVQGKPTQAIRKAQQAQVRLSMPTGGLNFVSGPLDFPDSDAYVVDNIIPKTIGVEIRKGWQYWVPQGNSFPPISAGPPAVYDQVLSIMAYRAINPQNDKLFCSPLSDGKIYDVTTFNANKTLAPVPLAGAPVNPGEWYHILFGNPADTFLCCVCQGLGYYTYSAAGGWVKQVITFTDGTTMDQIAYIFAWKARIWFLKANSTVAYYLATNAISGAATLFDFGPLLHHGGALSFGASWTYDAGNGIDDSLIIASAQGDILLYQGTDPASAANFQMKGVWYAGRLPIGRRCVCQHGGNTLFITEYGVIAISDLVAGKLHTSGMQDSFGYKINPKLADIVSPAIDLKYWYLGVFPVENLLIVGTPVFTPIATDIPQSYVMNSLNNSWATITNMDILCSDLYRGQLVFGTRKGEVCKGFVGYRDGVASDSSSSGAEVTGRIQTSFHAYGQDTMNKRMLRIKVYGISDGIPSIYPKYVSEYDVNNILNVPSPVLTPTASWDNATWDQAIWDSAAQSFRRWIGVAGWGKRLSLQMAVRGTGKTLLTDFESLFEQGYNL